MKSFRFMFYYIIKVQLNAYYARVIKTFQHVFVNIKGANSGLLGIVRKLNSITCCLWIACNVSRICVFKCELLIIVFCIITHYY